MGKEGSRAVCRCDKSVPKRKEYVRYRRLLRSAHSYDGGRLDFMPFGQVALCESRPWKCRVWKAWEAISGRSLRTADYS